MPTIVLNVKDLRNLIGYPVEKETLWETLSSLKCEPETTINDEITVEVTSDRPDFFSAEGIARGIRYYRSRGTVYDIKYSKLAPLKLHVEQSTTKVRPYIVAAAIRSISLDEEGMRQIMQLQEKLHTTYASNRKKASIGVYDLDTIIPDFTYTAPPPEEISFLPLESSEEMDGRRILTDTPKGREYGWIISSYDRYPLLLDSKRKVLSMPPIINSQATRITEKTRNLLIDVTGTEEKAINTCLNIMVTSILERGGSLQQVYVIYKQRTDKTPKLEKTKKRLLYSTVAGVSGLDLNNREVSSLLNRMGLQSETVGRDAIEVTIPPYRVDILHEVDLVEDIVMAYDLNRIVPELPQVMTMGRPLVGNRLRSRIRDLMVGMGFQEVTTYILSSREVLEEKPLIQARPLVEIIRPISSEFSVVRDTLMPKLLQFLGKNAHYSYPQKVFEYGDVVKVEKGIQLTLPHLSVAISDHKISFEEIQAIAVVLFKNLSEEVSFKPYSAKHYIQGRAAEIIMDDKHIGTIGEISPQVLINFGMNSPVGAMECNLSSLIRLESLFRG
ncbi:MAG: phenylalanine--tRNA ligase subunit beta [Candidatus Methanomethyliaceae archaeon]|nr:phenylalanine--tRNA ligase subunit beta [Candidatus Methanomethyliaceae archaeon]